MNEIVKQIKPLPKGIYEREEEFLNAIKAALLDQTILDEFKAAEKINLNHNFEIKKAIEAETIREYALRFATWYSKTHWK